MTTVAAIKTSTCVVMACDSAFIDNWHMPIHIKEKKIFSNKNFIFGAMGQTKLIHALKDVFVPPLIKGEINKYIKTIFIKKLRECLRETNCLSKDKEVECIVGDGAILVGYKNFLYVIYHDFDIVEIEDFIAIGSGYHLATAAIDLLRHPSYSDKKILAKALQITSKYNTATRPPFYVVDTKEFKVERI